MKTIYCLLTLIISLFVISCQDEDIMSVPINEVPPLHKPNTRNAGVTSGLTVDENGYWVASKCIPLVGKGRIVDNISDALVSVLGWKDNITHLVDLDIANSTLFSGVANVDVVANHIASVRDMTRTYAGGQTAGFVYKIDNTGLLTLNVLKSFWIETLLNGLVQETKGGNTSVTTLELNLLSVANNDGKQALSISTSFNKPFDEVRIGMTGISAEVLQSLSLYYAFVGDNPVQTCTTDNTAYFPDGVEIHRNGLFDLGWTSLLGADRIINSDLTDGAGFGTLIGLLTDSHVTVNFRTEVPKGTEVGFSFTNMDLLDLGLLTGTVIETYDANDTKIDVVTITSLLGISALDGGRKQASLITSAPCTQVRIKFTGINITLGATIVNYAFVREPVEVDASSYLSLSDVRISTNTYQLLSPETGTMSCTLLDFPSGAVPLISEDNRISEMTVDGDYILLVTYHSDDGKVYTQNMTITREVTEMTGEDCNTLISTNSNNVRVSNPEGGGSLISLSDITGAGHIIDDNPNNYATYVGGITVAGNIGILGIETQDGSLLNESGSEVRIGFTIQPMASLLGVDVLTYFRIRLKRNGEYIDSGITDENNAISAGLIGNDGSKMRLSIMTDKEFDAVELWKSGLLDLGLESFRIYNAFREPVSSVCYSGCIGDACLELITASNHGAEINYDATGSGGLILAGSSFNNLGNLLDNDKESAAEIINTTIAGGVSIAVKFNPVKTKAQVGFMMKKISGLIDIELLSGVELAVYNKGVKDINSKTSWGLAGAEIIGAGDYTYIATMPQESEFDEVRLTFTGVLQALKNTQLCGVFIRPDTDGDGVPDCAEESAEDNANPIKAAYALNKHVCEGDPVEIVVEGERVQDGENYILTFTDITSTSNIDKKTIELNMSKLVVDNLPIGDYYINIKSASSHNAYYNGIHATVHPVQSTWRPLTGSTKWNQWSNWTRGTPWSCTDVIIAAGCSRYPVLQGKDENKCKNIHFEPGAEVVNTHYLDYRKAWVELALTAGRYYMLSAPLHDMVTGDMFVPAGMNGVQSNPAFENLTTDTSPENRLNPRVLQRLWSSNAPGMKLTGDVTVTPDETNWTPPFNALNYSYSPGGGFSMMVDKGNLPTDKCIFRFPKEHTAYYYFNASGVPTGMDESINRTELAGRFIYETSAGAVPSLPITIPITNQKPGTAFLVGNPFMAHISIKEFFKANPSITSIKVFDGNKNNSLINVDGELLSNGDTYLHIAPMQSFFATVTDASTSLQVVFNEAMQSQMPGRNGLLRNTFATTGRSTRSVSNVNSELRITATAGGASASTLLIINPRASASFVPGEDAEMLMDNEVQPEITVFSESDGRALDIQQLSSEVLRIPLGISTSTTATVTLTLNHQVGDAWSYWELEDTRYGHRYPLTEYSIEVDVGNIGTHVGRFYLVRK